MALSSNSLIHFTKTQEALHGIIKEGFKLKYCKETFDLFGHDDVVHVPMVSFCDIPFSQIKNHVNDYGPFGIGLSKAWALKMRLNPVLYIQSNSHLANSYYNMMLILHRKEKEGVLDKDARRLGSEIIRYVKKYEGMLEREGKPAELRRFSDEREWRFVPEADDSYPMLLTPSDFKEVTADGANSKLNDIRLKFDADDINYLVIRDDQDIKGLIAHLRDVLGSRSTTSQIERLFTRIITKEQIWGDF